MMAHAMKKRPKKASIEPLLLSPLNPIKRWTTSSENSWELWQGRIERARKKPGVTQAELDTLQSWAYVTSRDSVEDVGKGGGFYHYCVDICGYKNMFPAFHGRVTRLIATGQETNGDDPSTEWLLEAFRFSFKSSIASHAYPTWLIAREYMLSAEVREVDSRIRAVQDNPELSDAEKMPAIGHLNAERDALLRAGCLEGVNITIGLQSEELGLATANLETCIRIMDSPKYVRFFGQHGPKDKAKGTAWGKNGATSLFRTNIAQRDPSIWTISLDAPRIGRHFDVVISDDLQSERNAGTIDTINQVWHLYRLHFALVSPPSVSYYSISGMVATRWHYDDIYQRIRDENKTRSKRDRTTIVTIPVCNASGDPTCPTIYPDRDAIDAIRVKLGNNRFATQMLLQPTSDATKPFQREWIQYFIPSQLDRKGMIAFTGVDFCWVEAAKRNDSGADHSVVMTWMVDDQLNRYLVDVFREQCTRRRTIEETARQQQLWKSILVGMSISDRKHVQDDIKDYENRTGTVIPVEWVSDLKGGEGVNATTAKAKKHIGVLQPLWQQRAMFIPMGYKWFEEELLYCPLSRSDDGMDATVCAVVPSFPAMAKKEVKRPMDAREVLSEMWRKHTEALLKGRPTRLDGTPLHGHRDRFGRPSGRATRRARARVETR
jgi:hypothetical protein